MNIFRYRRKMSSLTLSQLSQLTGVSVACISEIERDQCHDIRKIARLAHYWCLDGNIVLYEYRKGRV